jgi:thiamine-phosphate pyrophosphorylase
MRLVLPRLYVILDAALATRPVGGLAEQLYDAGVRLFQYRDKKAPAGEQLRAAEELTGRLIPRGASLIVNDRPDVAVLAGASGVHLGQEDLPVEDGRAILGAARVLGVSTHNEEQFRAALRTSADYIAVGPIFATGSKANPDPVVGTALLKRLRPLTEKPIVAIGGITLERAGEVIEAGADSVAVISDILRAHDPAERARRFVELLSIPRTHAAS